MAVTTVNHVARLLTGVWLGFFAMTALADDPNKLLAEEDVTLAKIKTFFDAAFLKTEMDENKLKITDGGFKAFIKIDEKKKLITYFSGWKMKESVSETKKLQLVNKLNDDLIVVRFSMPRPTVLWCDYQVLYEGGVTPYSIVNNYRIFAKVTRGAASTRDPDDIIGSD
ncbi:MAG: YbjN domain-containing protein [Gammaproteobacteria bacterium]|nr:YbjN domain-containing protein [Gammaproteobacteria bacterium]MBU1415999.1 YbjN domain-containing protein [Gammaproteobacteria bacterium]